MQKVVSVGRRDCDQVAGVHRDSVAGALGNVKWEWNGVSNYQPDSKDATELFAG